MRLRVITHAFPPSTHANAKRPLYLVKACLEAGWEVDVFSSPLGIPNPAEEGVRHPQLRIFHLSDPVESLLRKCKPYPFLFRMVTLTAAGVMWPDTYVRWARKVFRFSQTQPAYDRTLAFVLPASVLLSGRCPGLVNSTWTFDYQESVTPQQRRLGRRSPLQRWLLPRLAALEQATLHQAGRVVFTADTNRNAYIQAGLVPEAATAHVPYFFDAPAFAPPAPPCSAAFEIVYFGSFDWRGARSPETFLRALARFLQRHPEAGNQTRFVFYGSWLKEHDQLVDGLQLRNHVVIHPAVGYLDYLEKLKQSPVLLLVVASAHNLFMPSKIVDYFGAGRPILAFVPRESEMRRVMEQAQMTEFACDEQNEVQGAVTLEQLWLRYQAGKLGCGMGQGRFWSSEIQIPRYLELMARR